MSTLYYQFRITTKADSAGSKFMANLIAEKDGVIALIEDEILRYDFETEEWHSLIFKRGSDADDIETWFDVVEQEHADAPGLEGFMLQARGELMRMRDNGYVGQATY